MRISIYCVLHIEGPCISVHLLYEILDRILVQSPPLFPWHSCSSLFLFLVPRLFLLFLLVLSLFHETDFIYIVSKVLSKTYGRIVATGKHESVQHVPDRELVSCSNFGGGPAHTGCTLADFKHCSSHVQFDSLTNLQNNKTSHQFRDRGHFSLFILSFSKEHFSCFPVCNSPRLGRNARRREVIKNFLNNH